ncbi:Fic family protein [Accumulibacter sp.]|uniref:Fic family protein n=2 Tax=Accumulibacter sp. TaxID=2053492 RepID=UPI0025F3D4F9|nr:Fic family protein [Accumulibacter sp.]MCM8596144.1 Fic family protein [Accumulibacter sp.]MDS4050293.1 Fic family protein [Accumulibacter sp.]
MPPVIGYEYLLSRIPLRMPPLGRPAQVRPVTRIERMPEPLAVPRHVAPAAGALVLDHVLFALKHEGTRLDILHEALKRVPAEELVRALTAQRLGAYLRRAAFIWEKANGQALLLPWDSTGGNYIEFFEPGRYYTGPQWERSRKYRVNFNGIGPYEFCPVVARNAALEQRGQAVLERLRTWVSDPQNLVVLDRVMNRAYLSETRDSFAIESETPAPDKERAFLQAMEQLRDQRPLSEDYLVDLQNLVITSAIKEEYSFRNEQNWLQRGGHGVLAVRYVPPPPARVGELMDGLMRMANARAGDVPPLVKAALVSFGFVFVHPFMDGNGRLSRLLAHHSLSFHGALPTVNGNPAILPLSVAMKRNEAGYLATLESFSRPARQLWDVTYIADNEFTFDFRSSPLAYALWNGKTAADFVTRCAEQALEQSLVDETAFLQAYDQAYEQIDREFDLANRTINLLIQWIHQNSDRMPERRRNAPELLLLKTEQIGRIEAIVANCFSRDDKARN